MNNTQFRRMVLDTPTSVSKASADASNPNLQNGSATPALGSRMRSSIPMTPRSLVGTSGNEFARQVAERDAALNTSGTKRFRSSAAPKGTKLGSGYVDRTQQRISEEEDDKARRVKALEEMVKLGQMELATFEALRDEIVGGDVKNVHLVKGLDRKLLERVRRGEDVLSETGRLDSTKTQEDISEQLSPIGDGINVDEELAKLEDEKVKPIAKVEGDKKGQMAPPPLAGRKRTRDDILKELKASRQAVHKETSEPSLGPKFRKLGDKMERPRIERDERGREVLITIDENGKVKKKIRKPRSEYARQSHALLMPDKDAKPLGIQIEQQAPEPEAEAVDIFEGVGADYDPLADLEDDDESENGEEQRDQREDPQNPLADPLGRSSPLAAERSSMPPPPLPNKSISDKRNYFQDSDEKDVAQVQDPSPILKDPTILAALKKASTINPLSGSSALPEDEAEVAKQERHKRLLDSHDRDAADMDLGFGSSRFGDEEEAEEGKVKLSVWGRDEQKQEGRGEGKGPRKRGPKKRKADSNNAADVLAAMERRKAG